MTLLSFCRLVWRVRLVILGTVAVAVLAALVVVYFQTRVYLAQATILSPKESGAAQGMSSSLAALLGVGGGGGRDGGGFSFPSFLGGSVPTLSSNQDMFVAILKSRMCRNEVVSELAKKHGPSVGAKIVSVRVTVSPQEKGVIGLVVESTDPVLAAEAADLYFVGLDRILERLAQDATRRLEERYVEQLQRAAKEVADAEAAVLKFQAQNRVVPVAPLDTVGRSSDGSSARAAIDAAANLRGNITALEMQREVLRLRVTEQHPQMRELDKQISEMKKQYSRNLFGGPMDLPGEGPGQQRKEFFVSAEKLTPVQFAYLRLYRNLRMQEGFYAGALQGVEQLRYNEGVNRVRVDPLDPAVVSREPIRPRIPVTLLVAVLGGLVVPIVVVAGREYVRQLLREEREAARAFPGLEHFERLGPHIPDDAGLPNDPLSVVGRGRS